MAFLEMFALQPESIRYLLFLGVLVFAFIGIKIVYYLFSKVLSLLTKKSKTKLDDILVASLQKPIILIVLVIALRIGQPLLQLGEKGIQIYTQIVETILIFAIGWFVIRLIDGFLEVYIKPLTSKTKSKLDDTLLPLIKGVLHFFLYAIILIIIIQNLGFQITGLIAGLGIGGLAFALAAQDILANLFGGAAVIADRPFEVGDRIILDGNDGFVRKIGMRTTTLETFDGTIVVIPNKKVSDSVLENISRERARRTKVILGVEYSTSSAKLEKAKKLLAEIIKKNPSTEDNSLVHFSGFGPSSLDLQVIYWIKDLDNILGARDEVNFEIKKQFEKSGIEFAYPSQTIYVKK